MSADWSYFWGNSGNRSSTDDPRHPNPASEDDEIEPDQGNVLSHIISQLRPGADLSRVVLPTFILEPRSMLERITNFMAHPETLLPMPTNDDPLERFVSVVKFYLSGWHIKPPGVKKPLNPVLGETYTCSWEYSDGTHGYYISEQTSHHPPKSSYFFMAPEHHIRIDGTLKPRSKFLGNSAASMMEGIAILRFLNRGNDKERGERYILTQPNMYARGILFGKMKYELGDHSFVRCPENDLVADIEFKTKGYFSGTYNAIGGTIKNEKTGEVYYEISGLWNGEMYIKSVHSHDKELLFSAKKSKPTFPTTRPIEQQGERESQRLWQSTVKAIIASNHEMATDEKTKIEDRQREEAAKRAEQGVEWHPRLFRAVRGGPGGSEEGEEGLDWIINAHVDAHEPEKAKRQILAIAPILDGQTWDNFEIPEYKGNAVNGADKSEHQSENTKPETKQEVIQEIKPAGRAENKKEINYEASPGVKPGNTAENKPEVVERMDSKTNEVDQYVDAPEGSKP
ncbi:hypothetical protein BDW67DRAFT_172755 [Aspergillus spinulosporus]